MWRRIFPMDLPGKQNAIKKYLSHYSDDKYIDVNGFSFRHYEYVLVIPAYREGESFIKNLLLWAQNIETFCLVIVIVNHPENAREEAVAENNKLIALLCGAGTLKECRKNAYLIVIKNLEILVVGSIMMPEKMGVGLARKIGCDLALFLINASIVRCPIIYNTDADAVLPDDYFSRAARMQDAAGFVYPFTHMRPDHAQQRLAIELYEKRLALYVAGLKNAGSPYAFTTIGSTIAIHATSYAQVRGFPKLSAGEDFYLLNKVRKMGEIVTLDGNPIELSARLSTRVHFGTGPSLERILQYSDPKAAPIFYHPAVFTHLAWFLSEKTNEILFDRFSTNISPADLIDNNLIKSAWLSLGQYEALSQNISRRRNVLDRLRAFHDWFDAFRTLKFIHFLRERFPMCGVYDLSEGLGVERESSRAQIYCSGRQYGRGEEHACTVFIDAV